MAGDKPKFPSDIEDIILQEILDHSANHDLAIKRSIEALNPSFKERFGDTVKQPWFSHRIRKSKEWHEKWMDVWRHRAAVMSEKQDELESEFAAKLYRDEEITSVDKDGNEIIIKRRLLQKSDIHAFQVLDQSRRRRIAQMMPGVFQTSYTPKQQGEELPGGIHIHNHVKGKDDDD